MLCEKCGKNNATTHIRSVVNGVVTEKNLCSYCAAEEGYSGFAESGLTQMLASMFGDVLHSDPAVSAKHCECCNSTFSDIAESGKVGCSECYKTFYDDLIPYLKRVHGATKHVGRIPNRAPLTVTDNGDTAAALRLKLNRLVKEERFEEAAEIRDRIKQLEEGKKE